MSSDVADTKPRPSISRFWFAIPLVLFAALAGLFFIRLYAGDPATLPSALIGTPAPEFSLPPLEGLNRDGRPVPGFDKASLTRGQATIVNVFASWCAPCLIEHPLLMELARDPKLRIVGINYKDQPENARRFLGGKGNPYVAVGVDANGRTAIDWGVYGVPETFVVGPNGNILHKHVGPLTPDSARQLLNIVRKAEASG